MRAAYETAINVPTILLWSWTAINPVSASNPLGIDVARLLSPRDVYIEPPANKSLLTAQIGGIVGAYLFTAGIVGLILLVLGRRLRRAAVNSPKALDIEMVVPQRQAYTIDPSPISPTKTPTKGHVRNFSWPSPVKDERNPYVFPATGTSPINKSPITPPGHDPYVDARIVEIDRDMAQRDLEDIYAHVMEQDEAKAAGVDVKGMAPPPMLKAASPPKKLDKARPANINVEDSKSLRSRTSSIVSALMSPRKKSVKSLEISSPLPTPQSARFPKHEHSTSDLEPLAPRSYSPRPPPPVPTDQIPYTHSRSSSSNPSPTSPTRSIAEQLSYSQPKDRSRPPVSMHSQNRGDLSARSEESTNSQTPLYSPRLPPHPKSPMAAAHPKPFASNPPSNNGSTRTLPFRAFDPPLASPSWNTSTKTTVLERTIGPNGPQTGGLRTPWTGGPVPYSPYQPFSPVTPITPTLVTRQERKARKKAEGRAPVMELVKSDDEVWDSGY